MEIDFSICYTNGMELRHIRYFLAVAEARNFSRAAEALGISQPPLSQQIKALEDEVGAQLFRRTPHGAELTEAGEVFHRSVVRIPDGVAEAVRLARRAASGETGRLRLGITGTTTLHPVVPRCIRAFRNRFPEVELTIREANSIILANDVVENRIDLAFMRPSALDPEELTEELLHEEPLMVALPTVHPLSRGTEPIDLADLKDEVLIQVPRDLGASLHDVALEACRQAGFEPHRSQSAPQITSMLSLVAAELGFSLVPASMASFRIEGVSLHPIRDTDARIGLAVAYRRGSTSVLVRNFVASARALMPR